MTNDIQAKLIEKQLRKPGLRGKIDAKCIECIYDPNQNGGWRIQVGNCASRSCPLYSVRSKSEASGKAASTVQLDLI
ncbi:MAG: hypothetical protein KA296_04495 [Marinobacter sp.]|nr:hypothetical protein [Marinobacter sp.]